MEKRSQATRFWMGLGVLLGVGLVVWWLQGPAESDMEGRSNAPSIVAEPMAVPSDSVPEKMEEVERVSKRPAAQDSRSEIPLPSNDAASRPSAERETKVSQQIRERARREPKVVDLPRGLDQDFEASAGEIAGLERDNEFDNEPSPEEIEEMRRAFDELPPQYVLDELRRKANSKSDDITPERLEDLLRQAEVEPRRDELEELWRVVEQAERDERY